MKKIVIALLAVLLVASCVVGIVACDPKNPENPTPDVNVLDNYIFESNGQVVSEDFVLPGTIGDKEVTWSSDNSAITVTLSDIDGDWQAVVTAPETEIATVTLTVSQGTYTKSFTVQVAPIVVGDIADAYSFAQERATLTEDFSLETSTTYKGKTATIAWTVSEEYTKYINVSTDNDGKVTCTVNPQTSITDVQITATFTFGTTTAVRNYRMSVYRPMEAIELVDYWYNNTGVSIDMSGWVVGIATAYSESYGNISLYMVNDDLTAGYYLYRVKADAATGAALKPGVHVTVTGTTNTNYNGIIETNQNGTIKIDKEETTELSKVVKALDDELIGNVPALIYNESRLVSLTNWKVAKVASEPKQESPSTILTLEKEGATVTVAVSKYMEGSYIATATKDVYTDEYTALFNKLAGITKGSYVSVTGIFSYYNSGWQILPRSADDVTVTEADAEGTKYVGTSLKAAIKEVTDTLNDAGLNKRVTKEVSTNLPTSVDGVTISYTKVGGNALTLTENEGKVTINVVPGDPDESIFKVTYTVGEYSTVDFIQVTSLIPTAATMMDDLAELMPTEIKVVTDLPTLDGVDIKWEVKEGSEANVAVVDGQLVPTLAADAVNVFVKATFTYKDVETYRFFKITVAAGKGAKAIDMATVAEDAEYVLAVKQVTMGKTLYVLGSLDTKGQFLNTTTDPEKAETIYAEIVKDTEDETKVLGYRLYFKAKDGSKTYIGTQVAKNSSGYNTGYMALVKENAPVWAYDAETNSLYTSVELDGSKVNHYFGSYSSTTYETLSLSKSTYIKKDNTGVSQFPAFLATVVFEQLADNTITVDAGKGAEVTVNPESGKNGTRFTFTVSVDEENYVLDSVLVGSTVVEPDGNGVYTGRIDGPTTITVKTTPLASKINWITVAQALEIANSLEDGATSADYYYVYGTVNNIYNTQYCNFYLKDGDDSILVYGLFATNGTDKYGSKNQIAEIPFAEGDKLYVCTKIQKYVKDDTTTPELVKAVMQEAPQEGSSVVAPMSVAKALETCNALEQGATSEDKYYFTGTVTNIYNEQYFDFYLKDGDNEICVYGLWADMEITSANRYGTGSGFKGLPPIQVGDVIVVYGNLQKFYNAKKDTITPEITNAVLISYYTPESGETGTDTPSGGDTGTDTPSETLDTPEKIVNAAYALADDASLDKEYTLTGKIISIDSAYDTGYSNVTVTIVVGDMTDKPIQCFRMKGTGADVIAVNDTITVTGTLTNYKGYNSYNTVEFTSGCTLDSYTRGTSTISVDSKSSENATVAITNNKTEGENGSEFTFTVTVASGYEIVSVTVNGAEVTASEGVYTAKISGNTTILVETKAEGAADPVAVATFTLGDNGDASHNDGTAITTTYTETQGNYTLTLSSLTKVYSGAYDAKGNSCIKLGIGSAAASFTIEVPSGVKYVEILIGGYKANTAKFSINGTEYSTTGKSNDGEYDTVKVTVPADGKITLTTLQGGYRAMINTIIFYA